MPRYMVERTFPSGLNVPMNVDGAAGMQKIVAANGEQVSIAGVDYHLQPGIGELEAGCERNSAAVRRMKRIETGVPCHAARAADAGDDRHLVQVCF